MTRQYGVAIGNFRVLFGLPKYTVSIHITACAFRALAGYVQGWKIIIIEASVTWKGYTPSSK